MMDRFGHLESHLSYAWQCHTCTETLSLEGKAPEPPSLIWLEALQHANHNPNHEIRMKIMSIFGAKRSGKQEEFQEPWWSKY